MLHDIGLTLTHGSLKQIPLLTQKAGKSLNKVRLVLGKRARPWPYQIDFERAPAGTVEALHLLDEIASLM